MRGTKKAGFVDVLVDRGRQFGQHVGPTILSDGPSHRPRRRARPRRPISMSAPAPAAGNAHGATRVPTFVNFGVASAALTGAVPDGAGAEHDRRRERGSNLLRFTAHDAHDLRTFRVFCFGRRQIGQRRFLCKNSYRQLTPCARFRPGGDYELIDIGRDFENLELPSIQGVTARPELRQAIWRRTLSEGGGRRGRRLSARPDTRSEERFERGRVASRSEWLSAR